MASVRKEDIPAIAQFMPDFWALIKKYWITEDSDKYWEDVINECDRLYKKYDCDLFARKMVTAYITYLEEKSREVHGN